MEREDVMRALDLSAIAGKAFSASRAVATMRGPTRMVALAHAMWMVREARQLLADGRTEKSLRWLGFVQGVLWATGVSSIAELKDMNRARAEIAAQARIDSLAEILATLPRETAQNFLAVLAGKIDDKRETLDKIEVAAEKT